MPPAAAELPAGPAPARAAPIPPSPRLPAPHADPPAEAAAAAAAKKRPQPAATNDKEDKENSHKTKKSRGEARGRKPDAGADAAAAEAAPEVAAPEAAEAEAAPPAERPKPAKKSKTSNDVEKDAGGEGRNVGSGRRAAQGVTYKDATGGRTTKADLMEVGWPRQGLLLRITRSRLGQQPAAVRPPDQQHRPRLPCPLQLEECPLAEDENQALQETAGEKFTTMRRCVGAACLSPPPRRMACRRQLGRHARLVCYRAPTRHAQPPPSSHSHLTLPPRHDPTHPTQPRLPAVLLTDAGERGRARAG
jgi:hypothetical protein